jgi:hypothetical protein
MSRQAALNTLWFRLFVILMCLFLLSIVLFLYGGDMRVPAFVLLAGNVGAYVSIHKSLGELKDDELVNLAGSWLGLLLPSFVGGILAFVLYSLFESTIVSGQLFPEFVPDSKTVMVDSLDMIKAQHLKTPQDYAKLFVWAFIAGFNQKYVVDIIQSIKAKQ